MVENCKLTLSTNFTTSLYHFHLLYTSTPIRRLVLPCFIRCPAYYVAAAFVIEPILINNRHIISEFHETRARINLTLRKSGGATFRVHGLLKTSTVFLSGHNNSRQSVNPSVSWLSRVSFQTRQNFFGSVRVHAVSANVPCFLFKIKIRDDLSR